MRLYFANTLIQIHPMFLFIGNIQMELFMEAVIFKYILCSYLSSIQINGHDFVNIIQIHPMFLFIAQNPAIFAGVINIQIHPMFLFILQKNIRLVNGLDSNTSYVLIYRIAPVSHVKSYVIQIHPVTLHDSGGRPENIVLHPEYKIIRQSVHCNLLLSRVSESDK